MCVGKVQQRLPVAGAATSALLLQIYAAAGQIENCDCAAVNKLENFLDAALVSSLASERGRADSQMTPTDGGPLLSRESSLMVGAQSSAGTARSLRRNAALCVCARACARALPRTTRGIRCCPCLHTPCMKALGE